MSGPSSGRERWLPFAAMAWAPLAIYTGAQSLMRGLLDSGRRVLAGMLLVVPGILTDIVALVLLALPINQRGAFDPQPVTAGRARRTLDGDYRRLD